MTDHEIDGMLARVLACPVCKTPVRQEGAGIVCERCGRVYPIKDGIPVMLKEAATIDQHRRKRQ